MYVLIAVFSSEDEANVAQKRISSFVEFSDLQADVPSGATVTLRDKETTLFEKDLYVDDEEEEDDEDDDDYTPDM